MARVVSITKAASHNAATDVIGEVDYIRTAG